MLHFVLKAFTLSLALLLFSSCGLMNNSKEEERSDTMAVPSATATLDFNESEQIFTQTLIKSEKNEAFINELGYFNHPQASKYRILDNNASLETFFSDLNTSSQALNATEDKKIVSSWIESVKQNIKDSNESNLLFLPLLNKNDCPLSTAFEIIKNQAIISINEESIDCKEQTLYHALFYNIDKNVEEINVNLFGEKFSFMNDGH